MGEILTHAIVGLIEEVSLFPEKYWFVAGICLIWKLKKYTSDHRPNASQFARFSINSYTSELYLKKLPLNCLVAKVLGKKRPKSTQTKQIQIKKIN